MRSWMIGVVLGLLPVLLLPRLPDPVSVPLLVVCALLLLRSRWWGRQFVCGLLLGCALTLAHGHVMLAQRIAEPCVGQPLTVSGEITSLPRYSLFPDGRSRQRFEFRVNRIEPATCKAPRQVLLSYYGPAKMIPGERWRFPATLARPWGLANPGSHNLQSWFALTGIDAVGTVTAGRGSRLQPAGTFTGLHNRLRQDISERVAALPLEPDVRAVLAAVTVADKSGIDSRLWALLQQFGINHLLVISGLHIGLVAAAAYLLGSALQRPLLLAGVAGSWAPALLALLASSAYTALAGFSVSTQRALVMLICFLLAGLAGRRSGPANNLLLAGFAVLVINPLAALGSGFWLSFSAVAALLWLGYWQRGRPSWQRLLWTHGFMSLVMLPLGAWWFGGASLVAALANLLMVPLVGLFVVPLALLAVVSIYLLPVAELTLWQLAGWPLQQLLPLAVKVAGQGAGWFYHALSPSPVALLLAAVGAGVLIVPGTRWIRLLSLLLVVPLLLPMSPAATSGALNTPGLTRVTVLDVGQGTAVIVRAAGRTLVYDTGGGDPQGANMAAAVLLPYLRRFGLGSLDTLVISHPDNDHSAGTGTLLAAVPAATLYYGGDRSPTASARRCAAGQAWRWPGGQQFQFLAPVPGAGQSGNNSSCVLQITTGGHRLLLAGDIESPQERELVRYWGESLASDWLLVPHHGSRTSSSHALLKAVRPRVAVVSSGYANRFRHPHADVMQRFEQMGIGVYGTATGGALQFEFVPGQPVRVTRYRDQALRFWK